MISDQVDQALSALTDALANSPELTNAFYGRWRNGWFDEGHGLSDEQAQAADLLDEAIPHFTRSEPSDSEAEALFARAPEVVFMWCAASVGRSDVRIEQLVRAASRHEEYGDRSVFVVRNRIVQGPLEDALAVIPLIGSGEVLANPANHEAAARMELLIWEAGARALQLPDLGKWIWASHQSFDTVVGQPARGSLRGRVLAARVLEVAACGMPPMTDPMLVGNTLQVLQPLLLHPEPLVWISAARALGRLAGAFEPLEGTLLDWVHGESKVLRQRALTAFASLPKSRLAFLAHELESIIDAPDAPPTVLAAAAAATPYLFFERRALWDRLATRITAGEGGAVASRALARGLATLWRRGTEREEIMPSFRLLRQRARRAKPDGVDDWRRCVETLSVTDVIDGAERDPLDLESGLENLVRLAAHYDDAEADARAARFAATLHPTFLEAKRIVLSDLPDREKASAINALEACARSLALRIWGPMLATRPEGELVGEPDLEETWEAVKRAPAELLDVVAERRREAEGDQTDEHELVALEVLALKLGGYALDATGAQADLGTGRGPTAHDTCLWLRKLDGLIIGDRELPGSVQQSLSSLFWRLVDTTRGTALGEVDDVEWLGPFAAWWALVIDRPAVLQQLATALPMIADGALDTCCRLAETTRAALSGGAADGAWGDEAMGALRELRADGTELGEAVRGLALALASFGHTKGNAGDLEARCLELVMAAERLQAALADPVRALHSATVVSGDDSLLLSRGENAPKTAATVARAIKVREVSLLDVWLAALGPSVSGLVEGAVSGAIRRTPPPPPKPPKKEPKTLVGYELVKRLGEGGIGSVWLVRKPGADRLFVLKIPKVEALENASETEREGILASFVEEARALAGLYHPNVANIIDRGIEDGVPFLVLEYLIGADLKEYSTARHMALSELRQVVLDSCAGLTALHNAGLVHRDIKPANLWLRLPLGRGVKFDPHKHRDPTVVQPLSSLIIDFGMVRAQTVPEEAGGRFVAGTPGYIAPEQVLDPTELDGRADVYALAGTIYNVTTGRTFFDEISQPRERIIAHMRQDPMETADLSSYPPNMAKLMRAATARDWKDRPTPTEFGKIFAALVG